MIFCLTAWIFVACAAGNERAEAARASHDPPSKAAPQWSTPASPQPRQPSDPALAFTPPAELRLPTTLGPGERVPLLMILHGFGVSSALLIAKAGLNAVADQKKFAYLAPEGNHDSQGRPYWNAGPSCCDLERRGPEDVKRLSELLVAGAANGSVDPKRVFVIGYSNGGFMAQRLACDLAPVLAGVISVAGAAPGGEQACSPSGPLSVLEIHGDADPIVRYGGGVVFDRSDLPPHPSALETVKYWGQRLACSGELESAGTLDLEPYLPEKETERQRFEGCRGSVELWTVHGGGHYVALQPPAIDAMWSFVLAHPKG